MSDLDLKERLHGPVQWGYMCLADGGFIADDAPVEAADRLAALEDALRPFATAADDLDDEHRGHSPIWEAGAAMSITAEDLRNAARVLKGDA